MKFWTRRRIMIMIVVIVCGIIFGRLALRAFINLMLGGTMFGGDFL